ALEVALLLDAGAGAAPDERTIAAATLGAIRALAERAPVLLAIDDVQWLDGPSAAALAYAVRRLDDSPVSLLVGRRLGETRTQTRPFDDALAARNLGSIRLGPLSASALHHLIRERVGASLPRDVLSRVHATSGGNPFYALELARALERRPEPLDPDGALPVPDTLQGLVPERLGDLPERTKD